MAEEVWVTFVRANLLALPRLHPVARCSQESAQRWCDEHRKLAGGTSITWHPECKSGEVVIGRCVIQSPDGVTTREYMLRRLMVEE